MSISDSFQRGNIKVIPNKGIKLFMPQKPDKGYKTEQRIPLDFAFYGRLLYFRNQ